MHNNQRSWRTRGKSRWKTFQQIQASPPTEHALVFLRWEKFLPGSDGELTSQSLAFSVPIRFTDSDEKQTPYSHHVRRVICNGDVIPPFIFPHGLQPTTEVHFKCLGDSAGLIKRVAVANRNLRHATQAREPSLDCEKISATTSPLKYDCLIPQICYILVEITYLAFQDSTSNSR